MESLAIYKPCDATGTKLLAKQGKDVNMETEYGSGLIYMEMGRTTEKSHLYQNFGIICSLTGFTQIQKVVVGFFFLSSCRNAGMSALTSRTCFLGLECLTCPNLSLPDYSCIM